MMNNNAENKIKSAFENAVPDVLDRVLADLPVTDETDVVFSPKKQRRLPAIRKVLAVAAMFVIMLGSIFGVYKYYDTTVISSTVFLDVNPSVEIMVNSDEKVLDVISKNADGDKIIEGMNFADSNLDITVNAIVASMIKHGYISDISNSILVSVNSKDSHKGAELKERLARDIEKILETDGFSGSVLSQTLDDVSLDELSEKYGITVGKAQLIQRIISDIPDYSFAELAALSINELNIIAQSCVITDVGQIGSPSDKAYIGEDSAVISAINYAELDGIDTDAVDAETKLIMKDGAMVYEINLNYSGKDYGFTVNAVDGTVVVFKNSDSANTESTKNETSATTTTAPVPDDKPIPEVTETEAVTEKEEVKVPAKETETVLKEEPKPEPVTLPVKFTPEDARLIATRHAKLNINTRNVVDFTCELHTDNGTPLYKIRFYSTNFRKKDGVQYDYVVSAYSGVVISSKETKKPYYTPASREVFIPDLRVGGKSEVISSYTYYEYCGYSLSYIYSGIDLEDTPMHLKTDEGTLLRFDSKKDIDTLMGMIEEANLTTQGMDGYEARAFISDLSKYDDSFFKTKKLYFIPMETESNVSDINIYLTRSNDKDLINFGVDIRYRNEINKLPMYTFFLIEVDREAFTNSTVEQVGILIAEDANKTEVTKKYYMHAYLKETD